MSTRVCRDSRVKLSNQKLVFTQLTGLNVGDKTTKFTFQLVLQHNVSEQLARFVACLRDSLSGMTFQAKSAVFSG